MFLLLELTLEFLSVTCDSLHPLHTIVEPLPQDTVARRLLFLKIVKLLPPAYEVRREVIFSFCLSDHSGEGRRGKTRTGISSFPSLPLATTDKDKGAFFSPPLFSPPFLSPPHSSSPLASLSCPLLCTGPGRQCSHRSTFLSLCNNGVFRFQHKSDISVQY